MNVGDKCNASALRGALILFNNCSFYFTFLLSNENKKKIETCFICLCLAKSNKFAGICKYVITLFITIKKCCTSEYLFCTIYTKESRLIPYLCRETDPEQEIKEKNRLASKMLMHTRQTNCDFVLYEFSKGKIYYFQCKPCVFCHSHKNRSFNLWLINISYAY